jgi:hypothetical protein
MKSILTWGQGLEWIKVIQGEGVPEAFFDYFVYNLRGLGYHFMAVDEEAARMWTFDPPFPDPSTAREVVLERSYLIDEFIEECHDEAIDECE